MNMKKIAIFGIMVLALVAACTVQPPNVTVVNDKAEELNRISVTGSSTMDASPDQVEIMFRIVAKATDAKTAQKIQADQANAVVAALQKFVSKTDIQTTDFNLQPTYEWDGTKSVLTGYEASNGIKIKTKNLADAGVIMDAAVNAGANRVDSIVFSLSRDRQKDLGQQALEAAAKNARDKASGVADALGVKLGKLVSVQISDSEYQPPVYYARAEAMMAKDAAPTPIEPRTVTLSKTVQVQFEIG